MTFDQVIGVCVGILTILAVMVTVIAWFFKVGIAPLKTVIENCTSVVSESTKQLKELSTTVNEHSLELNKINTIHEVLGCSESVRNKR